MNQYPTITLEDHEGQIACKLTFSSPAGGFDPSSHAHQHAQILIGMMDKLCENNGPLPDSTVNSVDVVLQKMRQQAHAKVEAGRVLAGPNG